MCVKSDCFYISAYGAMWPSFTSDVTALCELHHRACQLHPFLSAYGAALILCCIILSFGTKNETGQNQNVKMLQNVLVKMLIQKVGRPSFED
jgi:hypothetical protein